MVKAQCKRSGYCCERIYRENAVNWLARGESSKKLSKDEGSIKILQQWVDDTPEDQKFVTCSNFNSDRLCNIHEDKPKICSNSLSPKRLAKGGLSAGTFFHEDCGYLRGAFWYVKLCAIFVRLEMDGVHNIFNRKEYNQCANIMDWNNVCIINGRWTYLDGSPFLRSRKKIYSKIFKCAIPLGGSVKRFPRKYKKRLKKMVEKHYEENGGGNK